MKRLFEAADALIVRQASRDALDFWVLFAPAVTARMMELNAQELSMCTWAASQARLPFVACSFGLAVLR